MTSPAPLRPMPPPFEWAGDSLLEPSCFGKRVAGDTTTTVTVYLACGAHVIETFDSVFDARAWRKSLMRAYFAWHEGCT